MAAAGSLRTPLLGTAMRSTDGLLRCRCRCSALLQGPAAGQHEDLDPVEELADLLGGALGALVLGGHPGLGGLLDDLLARGVHAVADRRDRARRRVAGGDLGGELGEQLVEGLHARLPSAGRIEKPVAREFPRRPRRVSAVARAATVASQPLSSAEPGSPARSRACSSVSQVRTPFPTGFPASSATRVRPAVTASQTYSKCGVPPRMTTPSATTASCRSVSAWATTGSSTAPGTRTTVGSGTPLATAAATARPSSAPVSSACQVVATMPRVSPAASTTAASGAPLPLTGPPRRRSSAAFAASLLCSSVNSRARSQPLLRLPQRDVGARHGRGVGRTGLGLRLDDVE